MRLWTVDVDAVDAERLHPLLSADDAARAERLSPGPARRRFVAARGTLRAGLGELSGLEPASLLLTAGAHGKPELADGGRIRFNVSHSGRLALVAVALGREVGVDVERVRPRSRLDAIARRCFSAAERRALAEGAEGDRLELFYRLWTAREAFVKATGRGLAAAAESFEVPPWPAGVDAPVQIPERELPEPRFSLLRLSPGPGYSGALVVAGEDWRLEHRAAPGP